jgi:RimJ/RimL family protein N-acetyltransferase
MIEVRYIDSSITRRHANYCSVDNNWNFAIELLPDSDSPSGSSPHVIGLIGAVRAPEIGYMFNKSYWGKGYCTEALRAFIPIFFAHYSGGGHENYDYAEALTDTELVSSHNVLTKAGFTLRGQREKDFAGIERHVSIQDG